MSTPWDGPDLGPTGIVLANRHRPEIRGERTSVAPTSPALRLKRWAIAALCVLAVVLIALSPSFGRAEPTGEYRPALPPDALTNGCYPLPEGVRFDFPYQVRSDGDVLIGADPRRNLVLQYDLIDSDEAVAAVTAAFAAAGFETVPTVSSLVDEDGAPVDGATDFTLVKGNVLVGGLAYPMDPLTADQIVRGTLVLDLPVVERQSDAPVCSDAESTKRFAQDGDT